MRTSGRGWASTFQAILFIGVLAYSWHRVAPNIGEVGRVFETGAIHWSRLPAIVLLLFTSHAVAIALWQRQLIYANGRPRSRATRYFLVARAWILSNLARYIPGKVWQLGVMVALLRDPVRLETPVVLESSLAVLFVFNGAGFALVALFGAAELQLPTWLLGISAGASLTGFIGPLVLGPLSDAVRRRLPSMPSLRSVSAKTIAHQAVGAVLAWLLQGVAFWLLAVSVVPAGASTLTVGICITAYVWSYLVGYVAIFAPGGIAVREGALVAALTAVRSCSASEAVAISVASRVVLTIVEVLPGLLLLAAGVISSGRPTRSAKVTTMSDDDRRH